MPQYVITLNTDVNPPTVSVQESASTNPPPPSATVLTTTEYIAQLRAEAQVRAPTQANGGPVPNGDSFDYFMGFVQNVKAPYSATNMGLMVVLVWWPAGTAAPTGNFL